MKTDADDGRQCCEDKYVLYVVIWWKKVGQREMCSYEFKRVLTKQLGSRVMTWELGDEDMNTSLMLLSC